MLSGMSVVRSAVLVTSAARSACGVTYCFRVALQASLMAECFADGAGDPEGGIGVGRLGRRFQVYEHAADGGVRIL